MGGNNKNLKNVEYIEGYNGVSYEDCWNLDNKLANIISDHLHAFLIAQKKAPVAGTPGILTEKYGDEKARKEWLNIIRKMIYAFEEYSKQPNGFSIIAEDPEKDARIKEGMQLFIEWYRCLWI